MEMLSQQMLSAVLIIIMGDDELLHDSPYFRTMQSDQVRHDTSQAILFSLLYKKFTTMLLPIQMR